jgi:dihydropteroate synthase
MKARIVNLKSKKDAIKAISDIGVYPVSLKFLKPKASYFTIKLEKISCAACNIIKQEMLSLGADAAVAKDVITHKVKYSDCLLFANLSQYEKLFKKLKKQPLGLKDIASDIREALSNYQRREYQLRCRNYTMNPGRKIYLMGILNITPDSFSDGGQFYARDDAIRQGIKMAREGADIIDVGGESTRPGSRGISSKKQIERVVPVIKALRKKVKIPISIDTRNAKVAEEAMKAGASIINDVSALGNDKKIAKIAAKYRSGLILMHSKGRPKSMQKKPYYQDVIREIVESLQKSILIALKAKVNANQIIVDPGIGFAKTKEHNLKIINKLAEFKVLGYPILIGTSRKSFIGKVLNRPVGKRLAGTIATVVYSILEGATIIRAHDVAEIKQAIKVAEAIKQTG